MSKITLYYKPTCTTCRQVYAILKESGKNFEAVNYYEQPISKAKLKELVDKIGVAAGELLRTKEGIYRELKLSEKKVSQDELLELMVKHPDLMQRPIVERGAKVILARPSDKVKEIL